MRGGNLIWIICDRPRGHRAAQVSRNRPLQAPPLSRPQAPWSVQEKEFRERGLPEAKPTASVVVMTASRLNTQELKGALRSSRETRDQDPQPFVWTKTADQTLAALA